MKILTAYHGADNLYYTKDEKDSLLVVLGERTIKRRYGKWSLPGGGWEKEDGITGKQKNYDVKLRRSKGISSRGKMLTG